MKALPGAVVLVALLAAPLPAFALWEIDHVTPQRARTLGIGVTLTAAAADNVIVAVDFPSDGPFKGFERVDLRVGQGDNPPVVAPLKETRDKPGRVTVGFHAQRSKIADLSAWIMVRGTLGGTVYEVRLKDFAAKPADEKKAP